MGVLVCPSASAFVPAMQIAAHNKVKLQYNHHNNHVVVIIFTSCNFIIMQQSNRRCIAIVSR